MSERISLLPDQLLGHILSDLRTKDSVRTSVYTCETLVNLKLCSVSLADSEYVSLPRLKIMHLENSIYTSDALLEKLISSCPVLEDVEVVNNVAIDNTSKVLRVRSQSLKSLIFYRNGHTDGTYDREAVIDAPGLKYLRLTDYQSRSFVISNLSSSANVDVDVNFYMVKNSAESAFSKRSVVRKFLTGLSSVRDMTLSERTLKDLTDYNINEQIMLSSSVPECLRSSLEYVVIKTPICGATDLKLVKHFLENSTMLKKLTLRLGSLLLVKLLLNLQFLIFKKVKFGDFM